MWRRWPAANLARVVSRLSLLAVPTLTEACGAPRVDLPAPVNAEHYRFTVGSFEYVAVLDGTNNYRGERFFPNVLPDSLRPALVAHGIRSADSIASTFTALAVRDRDGKGPWTLLDTGLGDFSPTAGRLVRNLAAAGIMPGDIARVILTHAHPDHVGGTVTPAGAVAFVNATYIASKAEWDFWTDSVRLSSLTGVRADAVRRRFIPVRDRMRLVTADTEVAPGIRLLAVPGHTPGHLAVLAGVGRERVLFLGDAVLHPIHLEHPEWPNLYDENASEARQTRAALLNRASDEGLLVLAYHFFPFPSLGRVTRAGDHWHWEPVR